MSHKNLRRSKGLLATGRPRTLPGSSHRRTQAYTPLVVDAPLRAGNRIDRREPAKVPLAKALDFQQATRYTPSRRRGACLRVNQATQGGSCEV